MIVRSLACALLLPLSLISVDASANYWDPRVCNTGFSPTIAPGETFNFSFSVSAQRNSDSTIPVQFYYSNSNQLDSSSMLIGSSSAFLPRTGSFCSADKTVRLTLPTRSKAMDCFIPAVSYIIVKVGNDTKALSFNPKGYDKLPTVSGYTPAEGRPGSIIHFKGQNHNANSVGVLNGERQVSTIFQSELISVVNNSAASGNLAVQDAKHNYCIPPSSIGNGLFEVLPAANYCASGASNPGFGRVSQVALNGFNNDLTNSTDCPTYGDYTGSYGFTEQGKIGENLFLKFNACGQTAYDRMAKIYIDWNNDSDFFDAGELVLSAPYVGVDTLYRLPLTIPANAKLGTTRMRIITALYYSGVVDSVNDVGACGYFPFGETQDYSIDFVPSATGAVSLADINISDKLPPQQLQDTEGNTLNLTSSGLILR